MECGKDADIKRVNLKRGVCADADRNAGRFRDGCRYARQVEVQAPGALTPEWWNKVAFPLTRDGRHPRTVTTDVATVLESWNGSSSVPLGSGKADPRAQQCHCG